jgi:hypothetical protein
MLVDLNIPKQYHKERIVLKQSAINQTDHHLHHAKKLTVLVSFFLLRSTGNRTRTCTDEST